MLDDQPSLKCNAIPDSPATINDFAEFAGSRRGPESMPSAWKNPHAVNYRELFRVLELQALFADLVFAFVFLGGGVERALQMRWRTFHRSNGRDLKT